MPKPERAGHIRNIVLFCGASNEIPQVYHQEGEKLGRMLAENGYGVIYGGGTMGLMGRIAAAALAFGAAVKGVIPRVFHQAATASQGALDGSEDEVVETIMIRKDRMILGADAGVVFPGGFGTLDELYEMIVAQEIRVYSEPENPVQPVIVVNFRGIFDGAIMMLQRQVEEGFIRPGRASLVTFVDTVEEAVAMLNRLNDEGPVPVGRYMGGTDKPPLGISLLMKPQ